MIIKSVVGLDNVSVDSYEGLTVEYAKKNGVNVLVRGVRNPSDFEYEQQIASVNKSLAPEIKTVFFTPKPENAFISSTMVREVYKTGGNILNFIPHNLDI